MALLKKTKIAQLLCQGIIIFSSSAFAEELYTPEREEVYEQKDLENLSSFSGVQIKFSELQQEIKHLNGRLEEAKHHTQQLEKKLDSFIADTEMRLQDKSSPIPPLTKELPNENKSKFEETLPSGALQEKYDQAIHLLREGDNQAAREAFLDFIKNNPKDALSAQAHYWIGMTYFIEKNYKKSAEIFAENYQKHAKSPKAFDALLRLAQSLGELGKTKDACVTLDELLSVLPGNKNQKTPLKEEAEKEKRKWKCSKK